MCKGKVELVVSNGAAIRRTSGITVNITNNATITGVTDATGVS